MSDRRRDGRMGEEGRIHRLARVPKPKPNSTDSYWLDPLGPSGLESGFVEAAEVGAEDRERSTLESFFG